MTAEKLFSRHALDNGLTLEFWDLSRQMAGDRWQVVLEARITIPIGPGTLPADLKDREAEIIRGLGPEILFSQRDERTFIPEEELPATLTESEARLLTLARSYFGHPKFAGRLIRRRFAEFLELQRWTSRQTQQ